MPEKKTEAPKPAQAKQASKPSKVYVQYTGRASTRSFVKADFESKGITDQDDVEFNHDNKWVAEVSPEAAGLLVGMDEFVKVDGEPTESEIPQVQQAPMMGETIPGERTDRPTAPIDVQDVGDSHKES